MGKVDLGEKLTCSSCGARYYDLSKSPALCPKCGTENERPKTFRTKKAEAPWINRNRRLAKDFEATIASARAFLYAASVMLLVRRLARAA